MKLIYNFAKLARVFPVAYIEPPDGFMPMTLIAIPRTKYYDTHIITRR